MTIFSLYIGLVTMLLYPNIQAADLNDFMTTNTDQQQALVDKHNSLRRAVDPSASNMLRMEWNSDIRSKAQNWVNQCSPTQSSAASRTVNGISCGENSFKSSILVSWPYVIQKWYDEGKNFNYGSGATTANAKIGLYTQVVSYNSNQMGCALASCPNQAVYKYFYVCWYCPAGNIVNQMNTPYKSGQPCGDCPAACDNGLCTNPCKYKNEYSNCPAMKTEYGCDIPLMKDCEASCKCTTEIM